MQERPRIITKIEANPMLSTKRNEYRQLKVAAYCRVSTDSDDQVESYKAQVAYYTDAIAKNPRWKLADIYADEGITGTMLKNRDNFTCCMCGNSTHSEPNLLLEIDHIIPISKGGYTVEENLQTLCWKCNRSKSNKIMS